MQNRNLKFSVDPTRVLERADVLDDQLTPGVESGHSSSPFPALSRQPSAVSLEHLFVRLAQNSPGNWAAKRLLYPEPATREVSLAFATGETFIPGFRD